MRVCPARAWGRRSSLRVQSHLKASAPVQRNWHAHSRWIAHVSRRVSTMNSAQGKTTADRPTDGDIIIEVKDARLELHFTKTPALVGGLVHWQHDTLIAQWHVRGP
jgi:hypothetical protein